MALNFHSRIQNNAQEIVRLHQSMHAAIAHRDESPHARAVWEAACAEFHAKYATLAFPGGPRLARERLRAGDEVALEYALAFLEVRPFFFRSGYMFKDFVRVLRNCPLSPVQRERYEVVRRAYQVYRMERRGPRG